MKVTLGIASALVCLPACLFADFSYQQTTKITGGAMAGAMKMASIFSKKLREPMVSTVSVKGNKMISASADSTSIIDLDAETMTEVNHEKKTYATIRFAEYTAAMSEMMKKMGEAPKDQQAADIKYKISVEDLNKTREIAGMNTKGYLMKMEAEVKDKKSGEAGSMDMNMEMWLAPKVSGYEEVNEFYKRMAQKMAFTPGGANMAAMGGAAMARGMVEVKKEVAKMDGIPVLEIMRMGGTAQAGAAPQSSAPQPSVKDALSGALGGFGGFGRKKKKEEPPKEEPKPEAQGNATSGSGALMEMTVETTSFSSAAIDASKFQIPAGYKQVEHSISRMK